jgi:O-antigen ligase
MYASVIVSTSRTGFILVTAELILVPPIVAGARRLSSRPTLAAGGLLIGMVVLLATSAGPDILLGRFAARDPYAGRREFLYSSVAMFKEKPLLGVGLGNWPTVYPRFALFDDGKYANQAHNDWAQWAVEGGIPLLVLMLWLAVWSFPRAFRSAWGLGIAAVFIHCAVDYPIQRQAGALVFFAVLGAVAAADDAHQNGKADARPPHLRIVRP